MIISERQVSKRDDSSIAATRADSASVVILSIIVVLTPVTMIVFILHIARYYFLKHLYVQLAKRADISKNEFKLHRMLTSNTAMIIAVAIVVSIVAFILLPIQIRARKVSVEYFGKGSMLNYSIYVVVEVIWLLGTFTIVTLLLWDIITSLRSIKEKGIGWFFSFSDPLKFRLEMIFFVLCTLIGHTEFILRCIDLADLVNSPPMSLKGTRNFVKTYTLYKFFRLFYTWFCCGGLTFMMQIAIFIHRALTGGKKPKNVDESIIEVMLQDEAGYKLMNDYCATEWSTENLTCWKYLYNFKSKGFEDIETVSQIYNMFIKSGAEMEVNIPSKTRIHITEVMNASSNKSKLSFEPFNSLYGQIVANLSDTLIRLMTTAEYESYDNSKKMLAATYKL
jgi:uncharacterized membrane protein